MGVEGWDGNQHAVSDNSTDPLREKADVAALNGQLSDGDERLRFAGLVVKNQSFHNAARRREKSLAKRTELYLAVTGLLQILQDGSLGEGPFAAQQQGEHAKGCDSHDHRQDSDLSQTSSSSR